MTSTDHEVALTQTVNPIANPRGTVNIHAQLLCATTTGKGAEETRQDLRRIVKDTINATFVAHLVSDANGEFSAEGPHIEGELPKFLGLQTILPVATASLNRQATQVRTLSGEDLTQLVCAPVSLPGNPGEVLVVGMRSKLMNLQSSIYTVELTASYQRLWARGIVAAANQWKLNSLAAIIELISSIEQQEDLASAANSAVNQVARYLSCDRVVLATVSGRSLRIRAASGFSSFDPSSEVMTAMHAALAECKVRNDICLWPATNGRRSAMLGHKSLAELFHFKSLLSFPLTTPEGKLVGAWLFVDGGNLTQGERVQNFVRAASPRVASAIDLVERSQRGVFARTNESLAKLTNGRKGRMAVLAAAMLAGLMLLPIPYRVRCQCVVEPVTQRYSVAPFTGMIDEGLVEPGDVVSAGALLAKMDGRELKWELSAALAKLEQAKKQRDVELTERNVPKVLISQLEAEQLRVQINILRYRIDNLELKSPIHGLILSGSLKEGQSTPVEKGDVLYEIGPLDELKIEIEIPAHEVAQVEAGQRIKLWLDGIESEPISGRIALLEPRSQLRRDQNVFIASLTVPNPRFMLRPGMRGTTRITGSVRPLGWNLFHKPWEYAVSRLMWW